MPTPGERRAYWNERYSEDVSVFGMEPNRFVAGSLSGLEPRRVLDLGAGQGRNSLWLAAQGHDVTAVDLSDVAIDRLRGLATENGLRVDAVAADLLEWVPQPAAFDLVLLSYLQLVPAQRESVHRGAAAAVAPGGRLFLVAHHRDNLTEGVGGPQIPEVLYDEEQLRTDFASLHIDRLERVARPVQLEGETHHAIDVLLDASSH